MTARAGRWATAAVTVAVVLAAATPAGAADGQVQAVNHGAETYYADHTGHIDDYITVHDTMQDGHGAVGWIEVQQADGSWNRFPKIYVGTGWMTSTSVRQDVLRELAGVRVYSCLQDGVDGTPYRCNWGRAGGDPY